MAHQDPPEATIYDKAISYNDPIPYNGKLYVEEAHKRPPLLFSFISRTNWVWQPTFTRSRARFRGPRESFKINLEMTQFYYDTHRVWKRLDQSEVVLQDYLQDLINGFVVESAEFNWATDATPTDEPVAIPSWNETVDKIQHLRERVRALERKS